MDKKYTQYLLDKTKQDYNQIAEDFSRTRQRIWEEIKFLFDDYIQKGDTVLDWGCGNGRYFELFKNKDIDCVGIDNSQKLIEIAKQKYPQSNFSVSRDSEIPFADNHFDKIYSIAVLHHIPSKELRLKFLQEAKRALKPGGLFVVTVWKFQNKKERRLLLKYTILKLFGKSKLDFMDILDPWGKELDRYYHWFTKRELKKLAQKAGFKIEKLGIVSNERGNRNNFYLVARK